MSAVPEYSAERVRRAVPADSFVVEGSTPVVSFGNPYAARVATLGLNPSASEFQDSDGKPLLGDAQRLESLSSLGVESLVDCDDETVKRVVDACYGYFSGSNPFWGFFGHMQPLLEAAGASYRDGSACHLDLVQWATDPLWSKLPLAVRRQLLVDDAPFLRRQLADTHLGLVLLNGATAVRQAEVVGAVWDEWLALPGSGPKAWLVRGRLEGVRLLGWTPYLPTGFVSRLRRDAILDAIRDERPKPTREVGSVAPGDGSPGDGSPGDAGPAAAPSPTAADSDAKGPKPQLPSAPPPPRADDVDVALVMSNGAVPVGLLVVSGSGFALAVIQDPLGEPGSGLNESGGWTGGADKLCLAAVRSPGGIPVDGSPTPRHGGPTTRHAAVPLLHGCNARRGPRRRPPAPGTDVRAEQRGRLPLAHRHLSP